MVLHTQSSNWTDSNYFLGHLLQIHPTLRVLCATPSACSSEVKGAVVLPSAWEVCTTCTLRSSRILFSTSVKIKMHNDQHRQKFHINLEMSSWTWFFLDPIRCFCTSSVKICSSPRENISPSRSRLLLMIDGHTQFVQGRQRISAVFWCYKCTRTCWIWSMSKYHI